MVLIVGEDGQAGAYLLHLNVCKSCAVVFGRYRDGRSVPVPAGEYVYVGSAGGTRGSTSLGSRLIRHASRSSGRPAHAIRESILESCRQAGLGVSRGDTKTLHWHIDYLLEQPHVTLTGVVVVRCRRSLEPVLASWLADSWEFEALAPGLGASDAPGRTHLLRVVGGPGAWEAWLEQRIPQMIAAANPATDRSAVQVLRNRGYRRKKAS